MKAFVRLYDTLDATTSTNEKVAAMSAYFREAPPEDAAWALFFLTGRRFKRLISSRLMRQWFLESTGMPDWLFSDSYEAVGDTSEAVALLLENFKRQPDAQTLMKKAVLPDLSLGQWVAQLQALYGQAEAEQKATVLNWWFNLDWQENFILNKLLSGAFRVGVSQILVARAVAQVADLPAPVIAHRLMGTWDANADFFNSLIAPDTATADLSRPYPFYLAYQLDQNPQSLGAIENWQVEWKWDGIRSQLIKRDGELFLWSRGEDLITDRFPEVMEAARALPDGTVLDGEILAYRNDKPLSFAVLQTRIGRKVLGKKVLSDAPVVFMAYDLLEQNGDDIREYPLAERRRAMQAVLREVPETFRLSPQVQVVDWEELTRLREESRERGVEGFVLKRLDSPYQTGRKKGDWWKWKVDPFTMDAVLIYAQAGSGRRANLFTDYTFAVWNDDVLVPVAKAYSGLSNAEIERLDRWIRQHTVEKFGPVRSVEPYHVFELAFEAIAPSSRHKSGVAVRFPRIARWRIDKPFSEADSLENLKALIDHGRQN